MTGTQLIQRGTIDEIVGYRNLAIEKFQTAFDAMDEAFATAAKAAGGNGFYIDRSQAQEAFCSYDRDHAKFLTYLRQQTDRSIWNHLIQGYGFDQLMDRQAHEEFRKQLEKEPPEVDVEIAQATLAGLVGDAERIFRRGIANAFSKLDRRFRSHDGFKIGERVVLTYAFGEYGSWNSYARQDDTIRDIERVFLRLDGKDTPERYAGVVGLIDGELRKAPSLERKAFTVENEYFRVRAFKNGNAHLWFLRDDLLRQVNKLLGEYYGEVLGAGADAVEDDPLSRPNTSLAKNLGWFPTPKGVADRAVAELSINWARGWGNDDPPTFKTLEPSAGEGALARAALDHASNVNLDLTCVELHHDRAQTLRSQGLNVIEADFLQMTPEPIYDRIVMNPPFDGQRDIDHVAHAVRFLAPGGRLVAIMAAGVEFRQNKKSEAFRALVAAMNGKMTDLPAGSFEESGTSVNTVLVTLNKKGPM